MAMIESFGTRPRSVSHLDTASFAHVLRVAIRYHHRLSSDDYSNSEPNHPEPAEEDRSLLEFLEDAFDDHLYVRRLAAEQILALASRCNADVAILSAERGSGKTTLVDRAARLPDEFGMNVPLGLPEAINRHNSDVLFGPLKDKWVSGKPSSIEHKTASIVYYSAREPTFPRSEVPREIAAAVLSDLLDRYLSNPADRDTWKRFRYAHSRAFGLARSEYGPGEYRSVDKGIEQQALKDLLGEFAEDSLTVFLRFVETTFKHRVVFAIDNLDSEPLTRRTTIAQFFARTARAMSAGRSRVGLILPLRPRNAQEIREAIEAVIDGAVSILPLGLSVDEDYALFESEAKSEDAPVVTPTTEVQSNSIAVISDFLERRVEFVEQWLGTEASELTKKNLMLLHVFSEQALGEKANQRVVEYLTRWHNGSLRAIGEVVERILLDALSNANPISNAEDIFHLLEQERTQENLLQMRIVTRLHAYRKFVFSLDREDSAIANIQRIPAALPFIRLSRTAQTWGIVLLKIHLLELLRKQEKPTTLAYLYDVLSRYKVSEPDINRAIVELASRRYTGDSGLLDVEGWNTRTMSSPAGPVQEVIISLQWSGSYLIDSFSHQSDYLFWAASTHSETRDIFEESLHQFGSAFDDTETVPFAMLQRAAFRVAVSIRFLTKYILPRVMIELPAPDSQGATEERSARLSQFHNDFGDVFLVRTYNSIHSFVGNLLHAGLASQEESDALLALTLPVREYLGSLWASGATWVGNLSGAKWSDVYSA